MKTPETFDRYWEIIHLFEDSLRGHFREAHPNPPRNRFPSIALEQEDEAVDEKDRCQGCLVGRIRRQPIAGFGVESPELAVVLGPPDLAAENEGKPLSQQQLDFLEKWLSAIELDKDKDVYYINAIRCRLPGDREPFPDEVDHCRGLLEKDLVRRKPKAVLALGPSPAWALLGRNRRFTELLHQLHLWGDIPVMVTHSPADVLADPRLKRPVWEDLKMLRNCLNEL